MKRYKKKNITNVLALTLALGSLMACQDDLLYSPEAGQYDGNMMLFEAYIGSTGAVTRSGDMPTDLEPLVLTGGDRPLYLHTYVCDNSFDPACMDVAPATRGAQVNDMASFVDVHGDKFGVHVRYAATQEDYVAPTNTVKLNDGNSVWRASGSTVYWPSSSAMMSVHAWAPHDLANKVPTLTNLNKSRGKVSFSYEAQRSADGTKDAEAQVDLLWAMTEASKNNSNQGRAELQFTHPLSAIKFAVRDVLGGTIKSITLRNVFTKGDCTYQLTADAQDNYTDTRNGVYSWTNQSDKGSFTQEFNVDVPDYKDESDIRNKDRDKDGDYSITAKKPEATFMMVPQTIPADAEIVIVMTQKGLEKPDGSKDPDKELTLTGKIQDNSLDKWLPGKEYVYTISTSSENWTYVFNVSGSSQKFRGDDKPASSPFVANPDSIVVNYTVTDGAYYNVQSYKYRSNNPSIKEIVAWTANTSNGSNISDDSRIKAYIEKYKSYIPAMSLQPNEWFPSQTMDVIEDEGSFDLKKYDVSFKAQYIATDYEGDWKMRSNACLGSEGSPVDLSKQNGGTSSRNTANCYIVNRGGWYAIPLYYGNAIKDGVANPSSYTNKRTGLEVMGYSTHNYVNHAGAQITADPIDGVSDATLVWEDAYNIIDKTSVKIKNVNGEKMLVFNVIQEDLQQANGILAVRDAIGTILWSWHLWVSDYWIEQPTDYSQKTNLVLTAGLVECEAQADVNMKGVANIPNPPISSFTASARNLGWCDAKNVLYLERTGKMDFVQTGNPNKPTHTLHIQQRPHEIVYWIGNNTYYQWGRKDPMVGFCNVDNQLKTNWGPIPYEVGESDINYSEGPISRSIKEPNRLLVHKSRTSGEITTNDWIFTGGLTYYNLWNNFSGSGDIITGEFEPGREDSDAHSYYIYTAEYAYSAIKTVYDPSPAGFVVPPSTFFNVFLNGRADCDFSNTQVTLEKAFNGDKEVLNIVSSRYPGRYFNWYAYSKKNKQGEKILLTPTGQRWDCAYHSSLQVNPGENMNPHLVYLWTNNANISLNSKNMGYSFALGYEGDPNVSESVVSTTHFNARKSMARPIRCIKEYDNNF